MGSNQGLSGMANDLSNQPHATEYTLQGVMRFLQTEWHRHERDRNAWEIEKQEMKGRIASLEGSARRADATQKALKKYVSILEKKVKDQAIQIKTGGAGQSASATTTTTTPEEREEFATKMLEKLRGNPPNYPVDDENQRSDLRSFLDNCQAEFNYLMISPANPMPPRESPPLPLMEDLRDDDYNMSMAQQQQQQQQQQMDQVSRQVPGAYRQQGQPQASHIGQQQQQQQFRNADYQPTPMSRSGGDGAADWSGGVHTQPTAPADDRFAGDARGGASLADKADKADTPLDLTSSSASSSSSSADAWDFNEGPSSFPEPTQTQQNQSSHRPDTDAFPIADNLPKSPGRQPGSHRRKGSMSRRRSSDQEAALNALAQKAESGSFKLRFGLRGHLDTVRTVIFSGGGSPGEPEICTAGDDGLIKRFHIPRSNYSGSSAGSLGPASDLDVQADFTHRGHQGAVLCLASWFAAPNFSTGGRATGDGWIFSGGQDTFIRVWERGRVDPKATIEGHTDAVWALCVLPATVGSVFGQTSSHGPPERIILISGAADGTVKVWAVSAPPQMSTSPQLSADGSGGSTGNTAPGGAGSTPGGAVSVGRRGGAGGGRVRGNSMSSGSAFASTPQPSVASSNPFHHTLIHTIARANSKSSPTCITALSGSGTAFVVSYSDAAIVVYDTRTGEEIGSMASLETYDGTLATSVNSVVATTVLETPQNEGDDGSSGVGVGPTAGSGVEGVIISGHEDQFIRFFDANSGQCTYNMLAHPAAISSLSLSPDGRELVSAGHDASLRFWSLEKRACTQEMTSHRIMRGEGVCSVVWSHDGRWVVSGGGDGVVKVFAR